MNTDSIQELDLVALRRDLAPLGLLVGDIGTVVAIHEGGRAFEVEFMAASGQTLAVETLDADSVEPFSGEQILHARPLSQA